MTVPGPGMAFLAAGVDDFLTKPVRPATLDDALTAWGQAPGGALPVPASRCWTGRPEHERPERSRRAHTIGP